MTRGKNTLPPQRALRVITGGKRGAEEKTIKPIGRHDPPPPPLRPPRLAGHDTTAGEVEDKYRKRRLFLVAVAGLTGAPPSFRGAILDTETASSTACCLLCRSQSGLFCCGPRGSLCSSCMLDGFIAIQDGRQWPSP